MDNFPQYKNGNPITESFIIQSMGCFRNNFRPKKDTLLNLIKAAHRSFESQSSLVEIVLEENEKITVCGDIHGQLFELLEIFAVNGPPREKHLYLFNGDFVDRGPCSIEVAFLLYAYKLLYPNKFFINRGNHETSHIHVGEEFTRECLEKYDQEVLQAFLNSFQVLPLATVIDQKYFVVHGGLSADKGFALDDIRALQRPDAECDLVTQLLWNDPVMPEEKSKTPRGGGKLFGTSIVDAFLVRERLSLIIRSHEFSAKLAEGYKMDGNCLTVFSAANYQGGINKGAYVNITSSTYDILTFESPKFYPEWYNPYKYLF